MSIIERSNPLNLQYRVCIVTSASSPLGVIICKTLLKANALVLGVDDHPKDASLNAGLGTHFQFEQCDIKDDSTPARLLEVTEAGFGTDRVDVLVNVIDREELKAHQTLCEVAGDVMRNRGSGSIINVVGSDVKNVQPIVSHSIATLIRTAICHCADVKSGQIDMTNDIFTSTKMKEFRLNIVRSQGEPVLNMLYRSQVMPEQIPNQTRISAAAGTSQQASSQAAYKEARTHMTALMKTEKVTKAMTEAVESKHTAAMLYDIGNLTLFLAGDMSSHINGQQVYLDGSCTSL